MPSFVRVYNIYVTPIMSEPGLPTQSFDDFIAVLQVDGIDVAKDIKDLLAGVCKAAAIADVVTVSSVDVNIQETGKAISALAEAVHSAPPKDDDVGYLRILTRLVYLKMLVLQKEAGEVKSVNLAELIQELSQLLQDQPAAVVTE